MFSRDSSGPKSLEEFAEQLKDLLTANMAGNARLVARLKDIVRNAKKADSAGQPADAATLLSRWLEFNLASYAVVNSHSLALVNGLLTAAENALNPKAQPSPRSDEGAAAPRVELRLEGRPGDLVTSAFLVENHFDHSLEVKVECDDLIAGTGASLPASLVAFEPAALSVGPRGQAVVKATVTITPDFVVGQTYVTVIRLLGLHTKEVGLSVAVHAAVEEAKPSGRSSPGVEPAGNKRRPRSSR